jgi:hypothetical protein
MKIRHVLAQVAIIYIAMISISSAAPPTPEPIAVEVKNTSANPVPVVGDINTSVSNFPATQDVSITNASKNPVPITLTSDRGRGTLNSKIFDVPAGSTEVFDFNSGFSGLDVTTVIASGLDENVFVAFGESNSIKLVLIGEQESGIGQEDYVLTLAEPIFVSQISVTCKEASVSCKIFVEVAGKFLF